MIPGDRSLLSTKSPAFCVTPVNLTLPDEGLVGITFQPLHSVLPLREGSPCLAVRHLHLRQSLSVHYRVLLDYAVLEEQKSDPQAIASITSQRILNPYPKNDFRYTMNFDEMAAAYKAAKLDDVKKFYSDFYNSANATI